MSRIKAPCYNCTKRHSHCHSECEAYREYRRELVKKNSFIKEERQKDSIVTASIVTAIKKSQRKKNASEHLGYRSRRKG